nr:MAG TPA: hypothetical protein [Caudoviricetes sp.]
MLDSVLLHFLLSSYFAKWQFKALLFRRNYFFIYISINALWNISRSHISNRWV